MKNRITIRLITLVALVLFATVANAQTEETFYYAKLPQVGATSDAKINLARVLKEMTSLTSKNHIASHPENVSIFDDRFELTYKKPKNTTIFYFSDLLNYTLLKLLKCHSEVIVTNSN